MIPSQGIRATVTYPHRTQLQTARKERETWVTRASEQPGSHSAWFSRWGAQTSESGALPLPEQLHPAPAAPPGHCAMEVIPRRSCRSRKCHRPSPQLQTGLPDLVGRQPDSPEPLIAPSICRECKVQRGETGMGVPEEVGKPIRLGWGSLLRKE